MSAGVRAPHGVLFLVDLHASSPALKVIARGVTSGLNETDCLCSLLGKRSEVADTLVRGLIFVLTIRCADGEQLHPDPAAYMGINALNVDWRGATGPPPL